MNKQRYFWGNKISDYGMEKNRVDYKAFAQSFSHILANGLMEELSSKGYYFEQIRGFIDNSDEIEALEEELEALEEKEDPTKEELDQMLELESSIADLEEEQERVPDIYQYYIVDDIRTLDENNEIVFYNEELDLYIWGVTHWGTSWDYVLTDIKIDEEN